MARLIMRRGPTSGTVYPLTGDTITIGRGSKNDIIIHDNEVSREHCRLMRAGTDFELLDLESSNGTFINGQRVVRNWLLRPGYLIELGDSITFEYERLESEGAYGDQDASQDAATAPHDPLQYGALIMQVGPDPGRTFTLVNAAVTIGRDLSNDIIIQDPEVSRYHARIRRTNEGYEIEDLGSTNGTQINDTFVHSPMPLGDEDRVRLGTTVELQFVAAFSVGPNDRTSLLRQYPQELNGYISDTKTILPQLAQRPAKTSTLGTGVEPGGLEDHVFLAYAREDWEPVVAELTLNLQDAGVDVWVDQYLTQGAADWRAAVDQALYECWMMVVVISPRAAASQHVKMAYRYFMNHDKPLIPLIYEPMMTLPIELARTRSILHDHKNPSRSLHKLVYQIKEMRKLMRP